MNINSGSGSVIHGDIMRMLVGMSMSLFARMSLVFLMLFSIQKVENGTKESIDLSSHPRTTQVVRVALGC
jgi:hypothetical protein